MTSLVKHAGLVAVAATLVACGTPQRQPARDPIGGDPRPQASLGHSSPQANNTPIGPKDPVPQKPFDHPKPQPPAFGDPHPQTPITSSAPQKPIFPADDNQADRPEAQAKSEKLSDAQILAVARVANNGEVEMAELARKNASAPDVKQFAAMMMTHHRDAMTKERHVQDKAKLQLEENDVSSQLKGQSEAALSNLRSQSGAEFDRTYINAQVKLHKDVLDTIDQRLAPDATSAEVKGHLREMRRSVASHLAKAEQLQKKLDPSMAAAHQKDKADDAKTKAKAKDTSPAPKGSKGEGDKGGEK